MEKQKQFLNVVDRDEAEFKFRSAFEIHKTNEIVDLAHSLGRILAQDVVAKVNVPSFDRSNFDGYAVIAEDCTGASEIAPVRLAIASYKVSAGRQTSKGTAENDSIHPSKDGKADDETRFDSERDTCANELEPNSLDRTTSELGHGELSHGVAVPIATGGMIPRGANAILMIEDTAIDPDGRLLVHRSVAPGNGIAFTGTDISQNQIVLFAGMRLTSRETGILAAIGETKVNVVKQPIVAVISTGNEIIPPGSLMQPGLVFDSNARIISDAVKECGGIALEFGIAIDDLDELRNRVNDALKKADIVLLSGGTSKGEGDLSYRIVAEFNDPGIVVHGVALKPGKPICLAVTGNQPVCVLPGFPTSAIFTFHEFIAPVIRLMSGLTPESPSLQKARLAQTVNSQIGRTQFLLVGLIQNHRNAKEESDRTYAESADPTVQSDLVAYPLGQGSGSVTTFSHADGFLKIDRHTEIVDRDEQIEVQLIGRNWRPADLVVIGSHCTGLDYLLSRMQSNGLTTKSFSVGSTAGLQAVQEGICDVAGIHLLDIESKKYNQSFVDKHPELQLIRGYQRMQCLLFRRDNSVIVDLARSIFGSGSLLSGGRTASFPKSENRFDQVVEFIRELPKSSSSFRMINRNQGSGTRVLIDWILGAAFDQPVNSGDSNSISARPLHNRPLGYEVTSSNHHAVATSVAQNRADWGIAITNVVNDPNLLYIPIFAEEFDFVVQKKRLENRNSNGLAQFCDMLTEPTVTQNLARLGLSVKGAKVD